MIIGDYDITDGRGLAVLAIDWVDDRVFRHRFHGEWGGLCAWLAEHPWWRFALLTPAARERRRAECQADLPVGVTVAVDELGTYRYSGKWPDAPAED